jgi:hypothetical protein
MKTCKAINCGRPIERWQAFENPDFCSDCRDQLAWMQTLNPRPSCLDWVMLAMTFTGGLIIGISLNLIGN